MKKGILFALILVLGFGFVACNETTTAATTQNQTTAATTTEEMTTTEGTTTVGTTADTVGPVITGVEDVTIYLDATFDPMDGVSAMDNVDGDLTDEITVAGSVDVTSTGSYFLKYTVEDAAGNKTEATRYVTVEVDPSLIGDEMIQNGDFSLGAGIWTVALNEGGAGSLSVVEEGDNKVGALEITAAGWSAPFPRLDSNVTEFENGLTYEVTFMAKADAARPIKVQVGQLLSAAPWFVDYMPGQTQIFDLTTEWQTFTFKFTMNQEDEDAGAMLEGQLLFNHGAAIVGETTTPAENYNTTVYYDDVAIAESTPDPDITAPLITGADDVTIETGTTFDPLEGVSVFDIVDGTITIDASNVTGTVDTNTPGDYTLTYTVSDEAGNEATATRVVTVVDLIFNDTDLVVNGDFEAALGDPAEWYIYEATGWTGAPDSAGTVSIVGGELNLAVTTLGGGGGSWILQAMQNVEFAVGETYKLTFDASAAAAREIVASAGFSDSGNNWHGYLQQTVSLTTDMQTFEYIFTVAEDNMANLDVLKFEFGQATDTVYIDNVVVSMLDQDVLVQNGDLSETGFNVWGQDWAGVADVSQQIVDEQLVVDVAALGDSGERWSVQVFQEGIALVPGNEYTISFDAKASVARDMNILMATDVEDRQTVNLTTDMTTFTFTFTYNGTATTGKLDFELGTISTASVPAVVTFDNITITDNTATADVAVVNGDFSETGFNVWGQDWAGVADVSQQIVDEQLVVDVVALGDNGERWSVQVFQEGITLIPGATYTIMFDAKASVARDMNILMATDVEDRQTVNLTTDMQTFTYTFTYNGTATTGKLDFELGTISTASVPATVTFDNIMVFRNFNPQA